MTFCKGTREEFLEDMQKDFPYASLRTEITKYRGRFVPWHWHKQAVEFFWLEHGTVECLTPDHRYVVPTGWAGFVNANVMHMRRAVPGSPVVQYLHIFEPSLLAASGSRIAKKYILPVTTRTEPEVLLFDPKQDPEIILLIREATFLREDALGYEVSLCEKLMQCWMLLFRKITDWQNHDTEHKTENDEKIKLMLAYIYEHFSEKLTVTDIARSAFLSERTCYRLFRERLKSSPLDYLTSYRIQKAVEMLTADPHVQVGRIAYDCGFQSSSYFGQVFKAQIGCSPLEFRSNLAQF